MDVNNQAQSAKWNNAIGDSSEFDFNKTIVVLLKEIIGKVNKY